MLRKLDLFNIAAATMITATAATAQSWQQLEAGGTFGSGSMGCNIAEGDNAENFMCLALRCQNSGPLEIALIAAGNDFGSGEPMPVFISVDGRSFPELTMTPTVTSGVLQAGIRYNPLSHADLLRALKAGNTVSVRNWQPGDGNTIPLRGSSRAIDHAVAACQREEDRRIILSDEYRAALPIAEERARTEGITALYPDDSFVAMFTAEGEDVAIVYASYADGSARGSTFDVLYYERVDGEWQSRGNVDRPRTSIQFTHPPRILPDHVEIPVLLFLDGDGNCCPTGGLQTLVIDRGTLRGSIR